MIGDTDLAEFFRRAQGEPQGRSRASNCSPAVSAADSSPEPGSAAAVIGPVTTWTNAFTLLALLSQQTGA